MILDKKTQNKFDKILQKYDEEYFDEHTKELIKACLVFIDMLKKGKFEYDTAETDYILWKIKNDVDRIDI